MLFNAAELSTILNQNSIRAVLKCASAYFQHKVNNIPLSKDYQSLDKGLSLESRVKQLEQVLTGIIQLVQPLISILPSHTDSLRIAGSAAPVTPPVKVGEISTPPNQPLETF